MIRDDDAHFEDLGEGAGRHAGAGRSYPSSLESSRSANFRVAGRCPPHEDDDDAFGGGANSDSPSPSYGSGGGAREWRGEGAHRDRPVAGGRRDLAAARERETARRAVQVAASVKTARTGNNRIVDWWGGKCRCSGPSLVVGQGGGLFVPD